MRHLLTLLLALMPATGFTLTVDGIQLPDSIQVNAQTLTLNGAGIRSKYFMDVYIAGLFLPTRSHDGHHIINADEPQSMRLVITSSHITRERLLDTIEDGIRQSSGDSFPRYKPMLKELWNALTFDVVVGDQYDFTWIPQSGLHVYRNGAELRVLTSFEFKQVLFGIWLGDDPAQDSLKQDLLSQ